MIDELAIKDEIKQIKKSLNDIEKEVSKIDTELDKDLSAKKKKK